MVSPTHPSPSSLPLPPCGTCVSDALSPSLPPGALALRLLRRGSHPAPPPSSPLPPPAQVFKFGGQAVANLLRLVAQNLRNFEREPIGPIGLFLGLRESK